MRTQLSCLLVGLIFSGPAWAEIQTSPADRIRDLYRAVPYERVQASPKVDILAHIDEMRERRRTTDNAFAVPDLDIETVMSETGTEDILMNPLVLEAIARMPADRAAQVLRMIEDRRAGLNPLETVPSLSLSEDDPEPQSLALRGWSLGRDANGAPFLQNGEDAASRVLLVPSMILADFGRVLSIQDDTEGFKVTLESGDVLEGEVRQAATVPAEPVSAPVVAAESGADSLPEDVERAPDVVTTNAPAQPDEIIRPRARPATLDAVDQASPVESTPPLRSLRPRARPADLATENT